MIRGKFLLFTCGIGMAGISVIGAVWLLRATLQPRGPKLFVASLNQEIPASEHAKTAKVLFPLKNVGDKVLEIRIVDTSCGCVVAELPKGSLLPGESVNLEASVDVPRTGKKVWAIDLQTNESKESRKRLLISGQGIAEPPYFLSSPGRIIVRSVAGSAPGQPSIVDFSTVESSEGSPWIVGARCEVPGLDIEIQPLKFFLEGDRRLVTREYRMTLRHRPDSSPQRKTGALELLGRSLGDQQSEVVYASTVWSVINEAVTAVPDPLVLHVGQTIENSSARFLVASHLPEPNFQIKTATSDLDWLIVTRIGQATEAGLHRFQVSANYTEQQLPVTGTVSLETSVESCPVVKIKVLIVSER